MALLPCCPHSRFSRAVWASRPLLWNTPCCRGHFPLVRFPSHTRPYSAFRTSSLRAGKRPIPQSCGSASPPAAATELLGFLPACEHAAKQNRTHSSGKGSVSSPTESRGKPGASEKNQQVTSEIGPGLLCNPALGQLSTVPQGPKTYQLNPRPPLQL